MTETLLKRNRTPACNNILGQCIFVLVVITCKTGFNSTGKPKVLVLSKKIPV